ncbi:twin-arginine translocation pathway signal [Bradyrhizobium sp. LTSP885]|uniref:hypothetical protein n=1 Tax=Bradyrhizobium sp. LTSP885 TaxID=1619232 RepID=UPI0005C86348|nr:hypothetical protein [Bradyrhizobium sp. LTSP885]KJC38009.1 twin-arginine translocation pathway signal [Bradyrhizobium sp. LTSP885]
MSARFLRRRNPLRAALGVALLALAAGASGCAQIGESVPSAFSDPAKYELYDCKQIETERKSLTNRAAEQEGLMAKAQTGVGGAVVSELAYRNELISIRSQQKLADEAWRRNKCHETPPASAAPVPAATPTPSPKDSRQPRSLIH